MERVWMDREAFEKAKKKYLKKKVQNSQDVPRELDFLVFEVPEKQASFSCCIIF
uniref:Uncharacterized protein n=1 Tax=Marseillevirus sp. TaxID=2809551 RepID=A0AA96ENL4_9VIRU|nr:hypothetical protein MarDSR_339 [Marseillevirus sp.]